MSKYLPYISLRVNIHTFDLLSANSYPAHPSISEHENVKAFISHAGILSTIEAIDAGIPVVAIPLFGDQYGNAAALRDIGIASIVEYQDLRKEFLLDAINEILEPK